MTPNWPLLAAGVLISLCPPTWFYGRKVRYCPSSEIRFTRRDRSQSKTWKQILTVQGQWIDFARAALATALVTNTLPLQPEAQATPVFAWVLLPGTLLSTLGRKGPIASAPVGFISGFVLIFYPLTISLPGLALGLVVALGLQSLGAFFCVLSAVTAVFGFLYDQDLVTNGIGALLPITPLIAAFLKKRQMGLAMRRISIPHVRIAAG